MKRLYIFLISISFISGSFAQTPTPGLNEAKNFTLDQTHDGGETYEYIARDYISLEAGFSYEVSLGSSSTFNGSIDEKKIFNVDYLSSFIDGESRDLSTSKEVGSIPGSPGVSKNGAAQYSIPIDVLPGVNGLVPSVSINYSSQGGNGLLGWGWQLSALSTIQRGTKSLYQDNVINQITFTNTSDRFFLDGNRLVLRGGTYGANNSTYYTEIDNSSMIKFSGGNFLVFQPDGNILTYQPYYQGGDVVFWYLAEIKDPYNNKITYTPKIEGNELVIDNISYAGNTIQFYYEKRTTDVNTTYFAGKSFSKNLLLRKIKVFSGEMVYREYNFSYKGDKYTLLNEVSLKIKGSAEVNTTIINWDLASYTPGFNSVDPGNNIQTVKYPGDYNGDGRTDILSMSSDDANSSDGTFVLSISNGDGTFTTYTTGFFNSMGEFKVGDFNNDGKDEIYMLAKWVSQDQIGWIKYQQYYFNGSGLIHYSVNDIIVFSNANETYLNLREPVMINADFNGDGLMDYIIQDKNYSTSGGPVTLMYNFSSKGGSTLFIPSVELFNSIVINYNGNKKADLLLYTGSYTFHPQEIYEFSHMTSTFVDIGTTSAPASLSGLYQAADFNGDGLTDLCPYQVKQSETFNIYYGTGQGFTSVTGPFTVSSQTYIDDPVETLQLEDLNGDGKTDIIRYYFDLSGPQPVPEDPGGEMVQFIATTHAKAYFSDGRYFSSKNLSYTFWTTTKVIHIKDGGDYMFDPYEFGDIINSLSNNVYNRTFFQSSRNWSSDFLGDGSGDVLLQLTSTEHKLLKLTDGSPQNLVSSVTNGMNISTEFTYDNLYSSTVYSQSGTPPSGLRYQKFPLYVVEYLKVKDLNSNTYLALNSYNYYNAAINAEFGFRGFQANSIYDKLKDTRLYTENVFQGEFYMPFTSTSNFYHIWTSISSANSSPAIHVVGSAPNQRLQIRNTQTVQTNLLNGTTVTTNYSNFNSYNRPESIVATYGSDMTVTRNITYLSNPISSNGYWLPFRVDNVVITKHHTDDASNYSATTKNFFDAGKPYQLNSKKAFYNTDKEITKSFEYETFGAVKKVNISDGTDNRYTKYTYTADNRFVKTKTVNDKFPITYDYDGWGNMVASTDHNGLTTQFSYNDMNQLVETILPDGNKITGQKGWISSGPSGSVFYTSSTVSGQGTATKYYNAKGQLLREEAPGALNKIFKTDYEYYADGKLYRQYLPYNSTKNEYVEYTYDDYGRVTTKSTPKGDINTTYTGKTVRVETPSGWSEKTVDDAGLLDLAEDDGGSISYTYYSSGLPHEISYGSNIVSMQYDIAGNRTSLTDPNRGTESAQYSAFGELTSSTNPRGITTTTKFDDFGRMEYFTADGETTTYNYNTTSGVLESITGAHTNINYTYDSYLRMTSQTEHIGTDDFVTSFSYNALGQVATVTYPGGYSIENEYDDYGSLDAIKNASTGSTIWSLNGTNNIGQVTNYSYGNGISTALSYDSKDRLSQINAGSVFNYELTYSDAGNLTFRDDLNKSTGTHESFQYDNLNRLTSTLNGTIDYDDNGNITYQDGLGDYEYNGSRPNAVTNILQSTTPVQNFAENISYTWFNKVDTIVDSDNNYKLAFTYGPDMQRKIMETYENGAVTPTRTKYYSGAFEKVVESDGSSKEYTYISAGTGLVAVNIKESTGTENLYYVHSDQQGSIMALSDQSGTKVEEYSYNAWGVRRNPDNWNLPDTRTNLILDRGYTGHEHLDHFGFINMNGRVYDAVLGRFLSPDPMPQDLSYTQNFNTYSYVLNNPLKYIDPSGYNRYPVLGEPGVPGSGSGKDNPAYEDMWKSVAQTEVNSIVSGYNPPVSGSRGYRYYDGNYYDNATGQIVDYNTAINGSVKYYNSSSTLKTLYLNHSDAVKKALDNGYKVNAILTTKDGDVLFRYFSVWSPDGEYSEMSYLEFLSTFGINATNGGGDLYFEGVPVFVTDKIAKYSAVTLPGKGIYIHPTVQNDIDLLRHEFGHILQAQLYGNKFYYEIIAPGSLVSCSYGQIDPNYNHSESWMEWTASKLSYEYFGRPNDWDHNFNPIVPGTSYRTDFGPGRWSGIPSYDQPFQFPFIIIND